MAYPQFDGFKTELGGQKTTAKLGIVTQKCLELGAAQLAGFFQSAGLRDDGTFSRAVIDELIVREIQGTESLSLTSDGDLDLTASDHVIVTANGAERAKFGVEVTSAGVENQIHNYLSVTNALRLQGQSTYTPSNGDTSALSDGTFAPTYSFYRLTPAAAVSIDGIFVDLTGLGRGQVLVLVNDSAFAITFASSVVSNARKILGDPVTIGQNGAVIVVYDTGNQGWRIVQAFPGEVITYTPTWTAASANPAIGTGAITGEWQQLGRHVRFRIRLGAGATTTFGTGIYSFSLPVASIAFTPNDWVVGSALALDSSGPVAEVGVAFLATTTTIQVLTHGAAGQVAPTVPFTWADNDSLRIEGGYIRA